MGVSGVGSGPGNTISGNNTSTGDAEAAARAAAEAAARAAQQAAEAAARARAQAKARPADGFETAPPARNTVALNAQAAPKQGPAMTPDQAFIVQFTDPKYNPNGPGSSTNCGPASLAMDLAYMGKMPPGLSKEQQVDYARALMCPNRSGEFTYVKDANGNNVPQLNRDHELTGSDMELAGIRAAGGNPVEGEGWDALDKALENGPVIANGYLDDSWRKQFPKRVGSGDIGHINTILGKTADGKYLVCDPMHTGGPVEMTKEQLSVFFQKTNKGVPEFVATNLGKTGSVPSTPGTPSTPSTGGSSGPGNGATVSAPTAQLAYDGGNTYSEDVGKLQDALVKAGYLDASALTNGRGYYGEKTKAAVAKLQADYGITGDNGEHYGPRSQAALEKALAKKPSTGGTGGTGSTGGTGGTGPVTGGNGKFTLDDLGALSRKYEGNIGTIANNPDDPGGKSYGAYQFALNVGGVDKFLGAIKTQYPDVYSALTKDKPGSAGFDAAWKKLAKEQPERFYAAQHAAAGQQWYLPAKNVLNQNIPGLNLDNRSKAVNDMVWSMGIQHGPGAPGVKSGTYEIFRRALAGKDVSKMSDEQLLRAVYSARTEFVNGLSSLSPAIKQSIANRYKSELADALQELKQ